MWHINAKQASENNKTTTTLLTYLCQRAALFDLRTRVVIVRGTLKARLASAQRAT